MSTTDTLAKLHAFLERCFQEDTNMALQAGHGFGHQPLGAERNAGWTDIDLSANVRASYDARFIRNVSPDRLLAECAAKRDVLRAVSGTPSEEVTLRALASVYADRTGYGDWDTPPFERVERGGTLTTYCTVCGESLEVINRDRAHRTSVPWEAQHRHGVIERATQ